MTDYRLSPDQTVEIAGTKFTLSGSFATLKAIQHAFNRDIVDVQAELFRMRFDEIVRLIAIGAQSDERATEEKIGTLILDEVGVDSDEYQLLKIRLMGWLAVAMSPKQSREKKAGDVVELVEKNKAALARQRKGRASRGKTGSASA